MSAKKIVIQQKLDRSDEYQELWPKTDCYTKTETDSMIQPLQKQVESANWQIGDVRGTVKNDLSDDWILCDGHIVNGVAYPGLLNYLGDSGSMLVEKTPVISYTFPKMGSYTFYPSSYGIQKCNNLYFQVGYKINSSDAAYVDLVLMYSSDLINWTGTTVGEQAWAYTSASKYGLSATIKHLNGYYICYSPVSSFIRQNIYYTTSLGSTWEYIEYSSMIITDVMYNNNTWILRNGYLYTSGDDTYTGYKIGSCSATLPDSSSTTWLSLSSSSVQALFYYNYKLYFCDNSKGRLEETQDFSQFAYYNLQEIYNEKGTLRLPISLYVFHTDSYWVMIRYVTGLSNGNYGSSSKYVCQYFCFSSDDAEMSQDTLDKMFANKYQLRLCREASIQKAISTRGFTLIDIVGDTILFTISSTLYASNLAKKTVYQCPNTYVGAVFDNSYDGYVFKSTTEATPAEIQPSTITVPTIASVDNVKYYIKGKESN